MKKMFTLTASLLIGFSLMAFAPQSMLSVSVKAKSPVTITVDNRNCNDKTPNDIFIRDIDAGYHTVKVFSVKNQRDIKSLFDRQQLIYSGNVYVKPGYHLDITINRFGKAFIDQKKINSFYYDEDVCGWNEDEYNKQPMNTDEFHQFKQTIDNTGFDNTKLTMAKQGIGQNYFRAAQVKEIVQLFSFEDSKLEIAKYAYKNCIDKNNYFIVNDAFSFSSSKDELARFLQDK